MERLRKQIMNDQALFPELAPRRQSPSVISIASTDSSPASSAAPPFQPRRPIVISDDEDDESGSGSEGSGSQRAAAAEAGPRPFTVKPLADANARPRPPTSKPVLAFAPRGTQNAGVPIYIPTNRDVARPAARPAPALFDDGLERVDLPDAPDDYAAISPADAEKALRELMGGAMQEDVAAEIDPADAEVPGFREGIRLLPHQVVGRKWMRDREDTTKKRTGGILADDMGLGKTIQTITRIVEGRATKSDKADGWDAATLVVCPLALLSQWASEIKKMAVDLRVIEHHGPNRTTDPDVLRRARVVITTYDVVKQEYASYNPSAKDESKSKSKSKAPADDDDDNEDAADHFGRTLASAKPAPKKGARKDALFRLKWWRVVLDEAHNIKNKTTKGAVACCELQAKFRWCLTGTPMQNDVAELYSLIKFLRLKPLNDWNTFNMQIAKPVKSGKGAVRAMKRLQVVLKQVMLRRRKTDKINGKALIELPARTIDIVSCPFDPSERMYYTALETKMEGIIDKLMQQEKGNSYTSVLLLLLRLRQACLHPVLVSKDYKADMEAVDPKAAKKGDDKDDGDDLADVFGRLGVTRRCQLCQIELTGADSQAVHCTDCAALTLKAKVAQDERPDSAKIRMILKLLADIDKRSEGEEKTIIFSQFTSMLDLIQPFLDDRGIKYVRYDGTMSKQERESSLEKIKTSKRTRVILISFKAGSTGLNLTACNNVILVDLWWNPALEDQAFDRAHRYGQTRDVNIFKLKIDDTVEDRILALQEKKRALALAALSGDKLKNMRLGMEDLLALFRPGGRDEDEEDED